MHEVYSILFGVGFTVAVSIALGSLLLRGLRIRLYRIETELFAFIAGSGVLSLLVTLLCWMQQARKGVFLGVGWVAIGAAVWQSRTRKRPSSKVLPALPLDWLVPCCLILGAFFVYYFMNALAPEVSPDGSGYHLGNVMRMWRRHGFDWEFRGMYAYLSQGMEMLFLFAFSFGRHSAAAMVHFTFLCALPLLLICYGRRFGLSKASLFAAIIVFASPVIGKDGVSAYNDLAVVTLTYAVFYLLQVWDSGSDANILILIGFLAGYAYAVKYTAALTLPFALGWIWWRRSLNIRNLVKLAIPASLLIVPWLWRNWVWTGNPMAPFMNAWFPNPYFHLGMELKYVDMLKHYVGIKHWWQVPLELTLRGGLGGGTMNPVFLMLPLSFLGLRTQQGRRLLLAALVFAAPAWFNTGTRFLIPSAPFAAMALGVSLESIPAALPVLALFGAFIGWPGVLSTYCDQWNWRVSAFPKRVALRQVSVTPYILENQPDYALKGAIEHAVPAGERIFSFAGRPDAYLDRDIVVSYESSLGNLVTDVLWAPVAHAPHYRQRFRFLPVTVRALRVVNNSSSDNYWTVAEMRIFSQGKELLRSADWRVRAWPNSAEVQLAFDNNYTTRWSTWQPLTAHDRIEVVFGASQQVDEVVLECDPESEARLQVDVQLPDGRWVPMTDAENPEKVALPAGIRLAATREVKALGFRYLLINQGDFIYSDVNRYARSWGMTELAEANGTHFFRID